MYKVIVEGVEIHCDTTDEAFALAARLRGTETNHASTTNGNGHHKPAAATPNSRWTASRFQNFYTSLNEKQKRLVHELVMNPDGLPQDTLIQILGVQNSQGFGPIVSWISNKAKKVGVSLQDVLTSEKILVNGEEMTEFRGAPAFIEVAHSSGEFKAN
jgi:hypothetical protein